MKYTLWQPFLLISLALCIGTMGTALPSPLYPLYQQLWQLQPSHISYIFVAYMFGCLATLLFLGRSSNSFGFVRSIQIGLAFVILGLLLSVLAENAYQLAFGRFLIGIASGLISTSAMLGLIYTIPPEHQTSAPQLSSIITVAGFGIGPLFGGSIAQFSAHPLISPYIPIIVAAIFSFFSLFLVKQQSFYRQNFSMAPHLELPSHNTHRTFYIASFAAFCAFSCFSLFASLAPSFIRDIIPWHGPLVSGATITSILMISLCIQIIAKRLAARSCLQRGFLMLICSCAILLCSILLQQSWLFFVSVICAGIGHGLSLMGAFATIHRITQSNNRSAVMATYLFIAYWGTILPIMAVGYLADLWGFQAGIIFFCIFTSLICTVCLWQQSLEYNTTSK
ncbi:MFS transporter [Acinetobacter larvae]|uniref:MFS transporter n=1 Tax=Acinetobacter larvae TaxID=1789224 RepID=A0A1B2M3L6_9GAMM|nr:MFS transporter [Acinetobacter larvae]AOA59790.1 MFS transporter [Acinetobacter larvae]